MLVCLVHGYILFLKLRHMCDGLVKFDPIVDARRSLKIGGYADVRTYGRTYGRWKL